MTDVHCHVLRPGKARQFVIGEDFIGIHPWETLRTGSVPNDELLKMAGLLSAEVERYLALGRAHDADELALLLHFAAAKTLSHRYFLRHYRLPPFRLSE